MPHSLARESVDAPLEDLWNVLLQKVLAPDQFILGALDPEVLSRTPRVVMRRMKFRGLELYERIEIDEEARSIAFYLIENPVYTGQVVNRIVRDGHQLYLELERSWDPIDPTVDPLDPEDMVRSLERTTRGIRFQAETLRARSA